MGDIEIGLKEDEVLEFIICFNIRPTGGLL
jgi:hypothetical protein